MSAIAMARTDAGVVMAGDAVGYDDEGIVRRIGPKLVAAPDLGLVLGNVGIGKLAQDVERGLQDIGCTCLDNALPIVVSLMKLIVARYQIAYQRDLTATLAIGGWSDQRARFETYKIHSHEKVGIATGDPRVAVSAPWVLHPAPEIWASNAALGNDALLAAGLDLSAPDLSAFDLAGRLVCSARLISHPAEPENDDPALRTAYSVGGYLQMVHVGREFAVSWIAHRWPDKLGEPIDPMAGMLAPVGPIGWPGVATVCRPNL